MGYNSLQANETAAKPLWERYQDEFPVNRNLTYLNHAAVAPLCRSAADAMRWLGDDALLYGSYHYPQWLDAYEGLRVASACLLSCHRDEIAIVKNTSEGIATVALGLSWQTGDTVVVFQEEFPANYYPWLRLERQGVILRWLSVHDPLERIEEACRGAKLLAISFVNYLSGLRVDLHAIGGICRRHNVFFFVDAIQGLGVFPVDVEAMQIDALAADGHKWLLGPEGCGILYVRRERLDQIEPVEFGWTNVARYADYAARDMTLRADAGRYECGTLNTISIFGLRASMELLLSIGLDEVSRAVLDRAEQVAEGVERKEYELHMPWDRATGSGIVTFRKEGVDSRVIVHDLKEQQVIAAPRQGWVRMAPHFHNSPEQIDRVLELLP